MTETTRESLEAHRQSYRRAANRGFKVEGDESAFLAEEIDRLRADIARHMTIANDAIARIDEAVAEEREANCAAIRAACQMCDKDGNFIHNGPHPQECEYCGRPIAAIRARGEG